MLMPPIAQPTTTIKRMTSFPRCMLMGAGDWGLGIGALGSRGTCAVVFALLRDDSAFAQLADLLRFVTEPFMKDFIAMFADFRRRLRRTIRLALDVDRAGDHSVFAAIG